MTYAEAMERYGIDKPDLRFGSSSSTSPDLRQGQRVQGVRGAGGATPAAVVAALRVPGGGEKLSRKQIDELPGRRGDATARKGLAYVKVNDRGEVATVCSRRSSSSCPTPQWPA